MTRLNLILIVSLLIAAPVHAADGLITLVSQHSVKETAERLASSLSEKGMTIFNRIDHSQGALKVGETLKPTVLLIFGNPKLGTALMKCSRTAGIDLPQKALIWEDSAGQVNLTYNDPGYLADRHNLADCSEVTGKITRALKTFAVKATGP